MAAGERMANEPAAGAGLRIGIVGAGRTQQGLGPYLALAFEAAGATVAAVSGRDLPGAERAARELAMRLGHPVAPALDAHRLASSVDVLVVASPVAHHQEGLDAALGAGVPCLCEKPLVGWQHAGEGRRAVEQFRARGILLAENCQWPFVLPVLEALHPGLFGGPVHTVSMGLSPASPGPTMVVDSLSHVLSVVQELVAIDEGTTVANVRQTDAAALAEHNLVAFELRPATGAVAVLLHLRRCAEQPRPAWLAVNGQRIDRRIGPDYALSFAASDGRSMNVRDPLHQLVYRFAAQLQANDRERNAALAASVTLRLRLYADILRHLAEDCA